MQSVFAIIFFSIAKFTSVNLVDQVWSKLNFFCKAHLYLKAIEKYEGSRMPAFYNVSEFFVLFCLLSIDLCSEQVFVIKASKPVQYSELRN